MVRRLWAPGLLFGAGARLRIEGIDAIDWSRPYVLLANHQSMIDISAPPSGVHRDLNAGRIRPGFESFRHRFRIDSE